jgi:hypothetical protein
MQSTAALFLAFGLFISWHSSPAAIRDFPLSSGPVVIGLPRWDGRDVNLVSGQPIIEFPLKKLPEARTEQKRIIRRSTGCGFCCSRVCIIDLDKERYYRQSCCLDRYFDP